MVDVDEWSFDHDNDNQLFSPVFEHVEDVATQQTAGKLFKKENLDEDALLQRVFISRMDGVDELQRDIMGIYTHQTYGWAQSLFQRKRCCWMRASEGSL